MKQTPYYIWKYTDAYEYMERVQNDMPPMIICVACNGGVQGKEYNEAIPETPDEIADSVYEAYKAGASMVHIHARNPEKIYSAASDVDTWKEVNKKVRDRCPEIIINNTTGGSHDSTMEDRLACLKAGPEMASLNLVPDMGKFSLKERKKPLMHPRPAVELDECIPFTYQLINKFAAEIKKYGVKPELETYHPGGTWVIRDLIQNGLLEKPYWIQTVMGYQTSSFPTVDNVVGMLKEFPEGTLWLCSGIGIHQLPMTTLATILGGHVRVGLEDNIYYRRGELLKNNAQAVQRTVRIAHDLNREIATPAQTREMLGLSATPSNY